MINRTIDLKGIEFAFDIQPSQALEPGVSVSGKVSGYLLVAGKAVTGARIQAAEVSVAYPEDTCSAGLAGDESVELR